LAALPEHLPNRLAALPRRQPALGSQNKIWIKIDRSDDFFCFSKDVLIIPHFFVVLMQGKLKHDQHKMHLIRMEQDVLDTNAGKQLS
jgi:hypothetical protein